MKILIGLILLWSLQFANAMNIKFGDNNKSYEKIIFSNNDILKIIKVDKDDWKRRQITYTKKSKKNPQQLEAVEDDILEFIYAYPSVSNAQVAILLSTCSGTICFPFIHVVYVEDDQLIMHRLGSTYYNDNLNFDINVINNKVKFIANNVNTFRKNSYGDTIYTKMTLLNKIGFIDTNFNKKFLKILDVHPETYFSNSELREKLAKKIGGDKFRKLRESMEVASNTYITNGHFIMMYGCMPHNCDSNAGIVLLDTQNENYYTVLIDTNTKKIEFNSTSTSTINDEVIELLKNEMIENRFKVEYKNNLFVFIEKLER
jgi:hypothetical protein